MSMSKPPSDSLYKLIHSLSPTEKRTITASLRKERGDYIHQQLFEALNRMKEFSGDAERKLRQQDDGRFATRKNYLFKAILRRLDATVDVDSRNNTIERSIRYGRILALHSWSIQILHEVMSPCGASWVV